MTGRPGWDEYFLIIAAAVATRGDCHRRQVGSVIVRDRRIVATGYNGAPSGRPGCKSDNMCPRAFSGVASRSSYDTGPGACIAVHAEANALLYADRSLSEGAVLYCTCRPCDGCMRLIAGGGISKVVIPGEAEKSVETIPV